LDGFSSWGERLFWRINRAGFVGFSSGAFLERMRRLTGGFMSHQV
jgi:hypothetical protein